MTTNQIKNTTHRVTLTNQNKLSITGVKKVNLTSETAINCEVENGEFSCFGEGLHVTKIDTDEGVIEAEGLVFECKYSHKREKVGFLKRVFK
ncbi:MAG: YabP/YqfC family sporulation protein [Firmicutes bacterium]|nr:YabP/YqfC family sporulation protein [Bacillota bacterium]MCL2770766.1 YabP/YqfC family sporulation protein [Bacillota bacterium]